MSGRRGNYQVGEPRRGPVAGVPRGKPVREDEDSDDEDDFEPPSFVEVRPARVAAVRSPVFPRARGSPFS